MKLQAIDVPLGKNRRKTPKIAPLIAVTVLLTIIPIYYPYLRYSHKKFSESSSPYETFDDTIQPAAVLDPLSRNHLLQKNEDDVHLKSNPGDLVAAEKPKPVRSHGHRESAGVKVSRKKQRRNAKRRTARISEREAEEEKVTEESVRKWPGRDDGEAVARRKAESGDGRCDIFTGEWVPNPKAPYYTNETCWAIQMHQNCMKYGRPDTGFMKWRWKPDGCDLPIFDPLQFLELVRGKSMAFVGDSVARNHMQSLICLLSRVVYPEDVSETRDENFKRWVYRDYNFNISIFWSPYLVKTQRTDPNDVTRPFKLFLDEFDDSWTTQIERFDYVIISAGHWFFRPSMFYLKRRLVGCLYCPETNITHMTAYFSYRRAFRTAFRAINSLRNYKGITFLRTFAPSHFENGPWDKGGDCTRTKPFRSNEVVLEDYSLEVYTIQLQEHKIGERIGRKRGLKFRLMDMTQAMLLRPDGHPSKYGHGPVQNVTMANDCVHWCLPGPVDTWNDFLLEMMKREDKM